MDRETLGLGGSRLRGPGAFRVPSERRFPSSTWERVPWAPRSGGVRLTPRWLSGLPVCLPPIWDPKSGLLGERVTGLAVARVSSLWPGSHPAHASQPRGPRSGMQGSNLSWRQAAPSGACTHLEWDSATLGISAPAPSPRAHV